MAPRTIKPDDETGEILTADELADFRRWNEIRKRKDPEFKKQEELLDDEADLHEIVNGKRATLWVWAQVGAIGKWAGIVIGAIVAWKTFGGNGGPKL